MVSCEASVANKSGLGKGQKEGRRDAGGLRIE
jgi:hypothetical protein